jgi:hypothetical protein
LNQEEDLGHPYNIYVQQIPMEIVDFVHPSNTKEILEILDLDLLKQAMEDHNPNPNE